jgi:hypothetical protein
MNFKNQFFRKYDWHYGVLVLMGLALYLQALSFDFVYFDDMKHLFSNPVFKTLDLEGFKKIWTEVYFEMYSPTTYSVWFFLKKIVGIFNFDNPVRVQAIVFHGASVIVHVLNACGLYFTLKNVFNFPKISALVCGLFFLAHPMQIEVAAWISQFRDGLAVLLTLVSFNILHKGFGQSEVSIFKILSALLLFGLALLSKASVFMAPVLLVVYLIKLKKFNYQKSILYSSGFFLLSVLVSLQTMGKQSGEHLSFETTFLQKIIVCFDTMAFYLGKLIFPYPVIPDYGRSPLKIINSFQFEWIHILPIVFVFLVWHFRQTRTILWSALLALVTVFPMLGLVPFRFQEISTPSDHYFYFPLLFGSAIFGAFNLRHTVQKIIIACFLAMLIGLNFYQIRQWQDTQSLAQAVFLHNPNSFIMHNSLGDYFAFNNDFTSAKKHYLQSVSLQPLLQETKLNLATAMFRTGQKDEAIKILVELINLGNRDPIVYTNLMAMLKELGREDEAKLVYEAYLKTNR